MAICKGLIKWKLYCAVLSVIVLNTIAHADNLGTIVLNNGEKYENVNYKVNNIYKIVEFNVDSDKKKVSFHNIDKIYNEYNLDITAKILGRESTTATEQTRVFGDTLNKGEIDSAKQPDNQETWLSENSATYRKSIEKLWRGLVRGAFDYSIPVGDYYEGINSGGGFEGDIRIAINHQLAARFMVSKSGLKDGDEFYFYSLYPDTTITDQEIGFSAVRYLAALEYYKHFNKDRNELSLYNVYFGLGCIKQTTTIEMSFLRNSTSQTWSINESGDETKFIMSSGVGLIKQISRNLGLEFSAGYDLVFAGTGETTSGENEVIYAYILDFKIGLCYFIK